LSFVRCGGSVKFNPGAIKSQGKNCEAVQEWKMARHRALVISTIVVALAGVGAWYQLERAKPDGEVKAAPAPIPVTVAIATREDLPIYLTGLGVVQASFTVGIRAQVVGMLEQVLFKEGEHVHKDDVLTRRTSRNLKHSLKIAGSLSARTNSAGISTNAGNGASGADQSPAATRRVPNATSNSSRIHDANGAASTRPSTPPIIPVTADNPAIIHLGDTYADPGAVVTDSEGRSLSHRAFVNTKSSSTPAKWPPTP
jgi:hypothetical protein